MKTLIKFLLTAILFIFTSCLKDMGNYDYKHGNEVYSRFKKYNYTIKFGDTLLLEPIRKFKYPESDTLNFNHIWYKNIEVYSNEQTLEFVGDSIGSFRIQYCMEDKNTGIMFLSSSGVTVNVKTIYNEGWIILYDKNKAL